MDFNDHHCGNFRSPLQRTRRLGVCWSCRAPQATSTWCCSRRCRWRPRRLERCAADCARRCAKWNQARCRRYARRRSLKATGARSRRLDAAALPSASPRSRSEAEQLEQRSWRPLPASVEFIDRPERRRAAQSARYLDGLPARFRPGDEAAGRLSYAFLFDVSQILCCRARRQA